MEHFVWSIDPVIVTFGSLQLRWYGVLFVSSFIIGLGIIRWIFKQEKRDPAVLEYLLIYVMVGTVIGARLAHCFFYVPEYYLEHPIEILYVWEGGLASHGGFLGVVIALYLYAKKFRLPFVWLIARVAIAGVLTAAFVRIGNFFNSEILGLPSELPWAVIFQRVDMVPRHPVQLYEAVAYLLILGLMLTVYKKVTPAAATKILPGLFLVTLFGARFFIEYTKTRQAEYAAEQFFSTGQLLSIPLVIIGAVWLYRGLKAVKK